MILTIDARIEFSFKGEQHSAIVHMDLDKLMRTKNELPEFYEYIAVENGIGVHTYEFELMKTEPIIFDELTGFAKEYLKDGAFDVKGFEERWRLENEYGAIRSIAKKVLKISDLDMHPNLKLALEEAFEAGRNSVEK